MKKVIYKIEVFGKDSMGGIDSKVDERDVAFSKDDVNSFILKSCHELSKRGYGVTGFTVKESKVYKLI